MRRHTIIAPWAIAAVLWSLAATPAFAATTTRKVAISGVDAGDCAAPSAPCRTITYALTQAVGGDTIDVGPGEFVEHVRIPLQAITIQGAGPAATTVIGTPCPLNSTFDVVGTDVTLRGLAIGGCFEGVVVGLGSATVEGDLFLETTGVGVSLAGGSATVLDSVFRSRAGVCDRGGGEREVVVGNTFFTQDTGVCVNLNEATVHHNRITNQPDIGVAIAATGIANVADNWWGCNEGPNKPGCATLTPKATSVQSWLRLEPIGAPTTVGPGETVTLSFGLVGSKSRVVATDFPAAPVAFSTTAGSVDMESATIINGVATTTFTAPDEAGVYTVTARLDGATATATFNGPIAPPQPTAPPTSIVSSAGGGDRGGSVPLAAIGFLIISVWLIRRGVERQRV
jgi:hypothetical protein